MCIPALQGGILVCTLFSCVYYLYPWILFCGVYVLYLLIVICSCFIYEEDSLSCFLGLGVSSVEWDPYAYLAHR